jgi:CubicO group peptidase (beta-lactamase class C family)
MATMQLLRSTPEEQGVSSTGVRKFVMEVDRKIHEMHSFMLLRHGAVVAEGWWAPYSAERVHMLYSLTKSFTSTAVGLAAAEGKLSVDDKVLAFFPEQAPAKTDGNLKAMRVRHLLTMSTGHTEDTTGRMVMRSDRDWVKGFLALPVEHEPGAPFVYNSGASYMLSAIVQKVTGMKLEDYLRPRLFAPLGIEKLNWETCPKGISIGGWGLSISTEAIARFGQLYLQKGLWDGKRILPEAWVEAATTKQVSNDGESNPDWKQGYGYQFWRCRHGAYRGDGAFGQYCIVLPEQEAVLAVTSAVDDMQSVLNLVWEHLLPAFGKAKLGADPAAQKALSKKCSSLALKPPAGLSQPAFASQVSGKTFTFEPNAQKIKSMQFDFKGSECILKVKAGRRNYRLTCREGAWLEGVAPTFGYPAVPVVTSGVWKGGDAYQVVLRYIETPATQTMTCHFAGEQVRIDGEMNGSFGPKELPQLLGKME